jgi:multisubunit Na+/H+ antiporter MnhB subunit
MPETGFDNLFVVALVALLAPLAVAVAPSLRVPAVVLEILVGIVLGPDVLGVVTADVPVQVLAVIGLAFLLFTVGLELDVRALRGTALRLSVVGYAVSLALGTGVGLLTAAAGWVSCRSMLQHWSAPASSPYWSFHHWRWACSGNPPHTRQRARGHRRAASSPEPSSRGSSTPEAALQDHPLSAGPRHRVVPLLGR